MILNHTPPFRDDSSPQCTMRTDAVQRKFIRNLMQPERLRCT
jgi:hypothetical protein